MESLTATRRTMLQATGLGAAGWLSRAALALAEDTAKPHRTKPARSLIILWLAGGPSQLETFDPHPGTDIAGGTEAIETRRRGTLLAKGLERTAEQMDSISLVRSLVSKEGDHERATYLGKTGYRPSPVEVQPSIGAVCCHQYDDADLATGGIPKIGIPRHVSILPSAWPARGGFLGDQYDAFKTFDPKNKAPDVTARVDESRFLRRLEDLDVVERTFARGRAGAAAKTRHRDTIAAARAMMASEQLAAFDVNLEPAKVRDEYGDTPFGRGCLAARRLVQAGTRCVEITLNGWDTHLNNHATHKKLVATLDPALAALIADLKRNDLLDQTVVLCGGEFGRTPKINAGAGRDHWPHGFSMAVAGGGIRGGQTLGQTDPEGGKKVARPHRVADVHATVLTALGINPLIELTTSVGRPVKLSDGKVIDGLLAEK